MLRRGITAVHDDAYHVPIATPESIDAIMRAYEDAGIRATVAIDQPNVVEYEKYPYLADLLPGVGARGDGRGAAPDRLPSCSRSTRHLIERWHGAASGRLAAAVSCSAPQRVTRRLLRRRCRRCRSGTTCRSTSTFSRPSCSACWAARSTASRWCATCTISGLLDERMMVIHAHLDRRRRHPRCSPKRAAPSRTTRSATCGSAAA